jgi:hypothetical protein
VTRDQLSFRAALWLYFAMVAFALGVNLDAPLWFLPPAAWFVVAGYMIRRSCVLLLTRPIEDAPPRPPTEDFGQNDA